MRVLLDTDVVIDFLMAREPFAQRARQIFELNAQRKIQCYIASITPLNVFYIARKSLSIENRLKIIRQLLLQVEVTAIGHEILLKAFDFGFSDYEDAVQYACAEADGVEAIVTRNVDDYKNAKLPVFTPNDFLQHLTSQQEDQL
jgi:predicted nucleic acid-binding protein